jgi:hypothetical protein
VLTPDQLKRYWVELRAVQAVRKDIDRADFHAQHALPASTKDFTKENFDTFLAACRAITQPDNLKPQLRALNQPKARLLHKILVEQAAQLKALGKLAPDIVIGQISSQKFYGRKPADLSANRRPPINEGDKERASELEMLMFTVARTISELRQEKGWTQHDLNIAAGLHCDCAACSKARRHMHRPQSEVAKPARVLVEADNVPF